MSEQFDDDIKLNPPAAKARPSPKSPADKPFDATLTAPQLRKQMALNFNALMKVFRLPDVPEDEPGPGILHFDETAFQNPADGFIILVNEHAQLRIMARMLAPLAAILEMANVFDRIRRAIMRQRELREAEKQRRQVAQAQVNTDLAEEIGANGSPESRGESILRRIRK